MKIYAISNQCTMLWTLCIATAMETNLVFDLTPEQIFTNASDLVQREVEFFKSLALIQDPSLENMVLPTIDFENEYLAHTSLFKFYSQVSPSNQVRQASTGVLSYINNNPQFLISENLFKAHQHLQKDINEESTTDPEYVRYLESSISEHIRNSFALSPQGQAKASWFEEELTDLCTNFIANIQKNQEHVDFRAEELVGLPSEFLQQYNLSGTNSTIEVRLGRRFIDILPILKYAKLEATRKKAYLACVNQVPENVEILRKIVKARLKLAKVLGYRSCSDFVIEKQMAKSKENVLKFLNEMKKGLYPLAKAEVAKMLAFKNSILEAEGLPPQQKYYAWDDEYYTTLMYQSIYEIDQEQVSEYFPLQQTINKILDMCESMFELKFVKIDTSDPQTVWHEDAVKYSVYQKSQSGESNPEFVGYLYFDLLARDGKFPYSKTFQILPSFIRRDGSYLPGSVAIVCNFNKPSTSVPFLLYHHQVSEILHEVGNALRILLSRTKSVRFSGANVPKDFSECPSRIMQFLAYSKPDLQNLSSHFKTGDPIPDTLATKLIKGAAVNPAMTTYHQMMLSYFDIALHGVESEEEAENLDITRIWRSYYEDANLLTNNGAEDIGFTTFEHIAIGYHSAYYSFCYSYIFAVDIFYSLLKEKEMRSKNGPLFKNLVLKHGGSKNASDMLKELLGRDPSPDVFIKELYSAADLDSVSQ